MKTLAILTLVAVAAVAHAQPTDPSQPPGQGSGSGSAQTGSGSGSGGPRIIQLPTDSNAPQVSAAASPTEVRLGQKFTVFVTATFNPGVEVNLREPLELGGVFEVVRKLSADKPAGDGRTTREWQIEVIAWELGDLIMPPIAVTYTAFGKADQLLTNRVNIRVIGMLGDVVDDPKALRGNSDPRDLLARDWFWLFVAGGGFLVLVALIILIATVRSRRRRSQVGGLVPMVGRKHRTAADRALDQLSAIEASGVLDRDDERKQGYFEMVEVIREYVGTRYRVLTLDLTSSEMLRELKKADAPNIERDMIEHFLDRCDIVKYGGFKATTTDAHDTLEGARGLVRVIDQPPAPIDGVVQAGDAAPRDDMPAGAGVAQADAEPPQEVV
jgi:hypothetical protein